MSAALAPPGSVAEAPTGRRPSVWDLAALSAVASAACAVQRGRLLSFATGMGRSRIIDATCVLVIGASIVFMVVTMVASRLGPIDAARRMIRLGTDPPGAWVAPSLGALTALPVFALYSPFIRPDDADSTRVAAAVTYVRDGHFGFLVETQDNLVPHLVLGPLMWMGGIPAAKVYSLVSVVLCAAIVAYITERLSHSVGGAVAAALTLVSFVPVLSQAVRLPMYPTMLAFGYAASWCSYQAISQPRATRHLAPLAGLLLVLAFEAQAVGLLFLTVPALLLVIVVRRVQLAQILRIYAFTGLFAVPRLAINLSSGGLRKISSFRTDYWITNGYVKEIQRNFWHYEGVSETLPTFVRRLPGRLLTALGPWSWLTLLALAIVIWRVATPRTRVFAAAAAGLFLAAITVKRVPPFPRYLAPTWPALAIVVGVAIGSALRSRRRGMWAAGLAGVLAVTAVFAVNARGMVQAQEYPRSVAEQGPYRQLAELLDGRGVIGARSHQVFFVVSDEVLTYGGQFLSERDYVTYLTWPSDADVVEMLERHDIGWVVIYPKRELETAYHDTWLVPHHGARARQVQAVASSPSFTLRADIDGYLLYELTAQP